MATFNDSTADNSFDPLTLPLLMKAVDNTGNHNNVAEALLPLINQDDPPEQLQAKLLQVIKEQGLSDVIALEVIKITLPAKLAVKIGDFRSQALLKRR